MNKLKVYRASAGSGKTFTLAVEFIHLLIINPLNYRNILAVTFTNKATGEMKERIISKLHGLASGDGSAEDYIEPLQQLFDQDGGLIFSRQKIAERARQALDFIIHDYSHFRVETIDSFFQSIIRQLARELNLTANLRVDLKQDEALQEAVQTMIDSITDDEEVHSAIRSYVMDNLEAGAKWNITEPMTQFAKNIFNEVYLKNKELMKGKTDVKTFRAFKQKLRKRQKELDDEQKAIGQDFMDLCCHHGFTMDNFTGKSKGIWSFFQKLAQGDTPNITATVEKFRTDHWSKETAVQALEPQMTAMLEDAIRTISANAPVKAGIRLLLTNLNQTMLLGKVNEKLRQLNDEANRFLLADTAYFLRELIAGNDIPFIYEKAGTQFQYIMIDEFQDTSELQWDNFQPLIANSLSGGNSCLIVGDVKQSIYRWRNSDWSILNNIGQSRFSQYIDDRPLDTNYRSDGNIIDFNNTFFTSATELLVKRFNDICGGAATMTQDIISAYSDVEQKTPEKHKDSGYVEVRMFDNEDPEGSYTDDTLTHLTTQIHQLMADGVRQDDMAILVRDTREAQLVSNHLKQQLPPGANIISSVAFMLGSSPAISLIISALRVLASPAERFLRLNLAYQYQRLMNPQDDISIHRFFSLGTETADALLPEGFTHEEENLIFMPLYELCGRLYTLFHLERISGQDAYMFTFFDELAAFVHDKPNTIATFLDYWDGTLQTATIPGAQSDGIQVMTIHKSKGLEFHTVFIPFCDWPIEVDAKHQPLIWCQPHTDEFKDLPLAALRFGNDMHESEFSDEYNREQLKTFVDNLNIMYVAFTRPSHNLFIYSGRNVRKTKDGNEAKHPFDCHDLLKAWKENVSAPLQKMDNKAEEEKAGEVIYVNGDICLSKKPEEEERGCIDVGFGYSQLPAEFRQSNKSHEFIDASTSPEEQDDGARQDYYISKGLVVHKIMEMITTPDDIDSVMLSLDCEGAFPDAEFRADVARTVKKAFGDPRAKVWFEPRWTVLNEHGIISVDTDGKTITRRPDRVITDSNETIVIDYKTGRQSNGHAAQVEQYISLLKQMGYPNVHGYLWYLTRNDIISL